MEFLLPGKNKNWWACSNRFLWITVIVLLIPALSCKEEIILSTQESLSDPRVSPRVIYTVPKMNSKGPYKELTEEYVPFTIRFNKIMNRSSVARALQMTSPMRDVGIGWVNDLAGHVFTFGAIDPRRYESIFSSVKIGEVFTISFSDTVEDINGNIILPNILGTFEPEPFFRVTRVSPSDQTQLFSTMISVSFNSVIDTSIFRTVRIIPPLKGTWSIDRYDDNTGVFQITGPIQPGAYDLTITTGAHDVDEHFLQESFHSSFNVRGFEVQSPPVSDMTYLFEPFSVGFSSALDFNTIQHAFHISPLLACSLFFSYDVSTIHVQPLGEYRPLTTYTVTFDTTLRNYLGVPLTEPQVVSFRTPTFRVLSTSPAQFETGVPRRGDINVRFNSKFDTSTIRQSFKITPATPGIFIIRNLFDYAMQPIYYFYPNDSLGFYQTYTVTIDTSLRSIGGAKLTAPYTFSFTTGGE